MDVTKLHQQVTLLMVYYVSMCTIYLTTMEREESLTPVCTGICKEYPELCSTTGTGEELQY